MTRPLRRGLARLRARVRSLLIVLGCSRAVIFLGAILVLLFVGDYALRLPLGVRQVAFFATLAGLGVVIVRRLVLPLREPLSDAVLATRVEERYPELADRLVSSLAFLDAADDPDNEDSPALMRAVIEETAAITPRIRFADVAHARLSVRWAAGAATVIFCAGTAALAQPELAETFLQRDILLRDVSWPRRTTLHVVDMEPGVARSVTLHHDTTLRIRADGAVPERIELRFRETSGRDTGWGRSGGVEEVVELAPTVDDPSLFSFNLNVDADYEFTVTGGDDDRAEVYRIRALTPPAVVKIELHCTYPAYLERPTEVLTDGDQRVPEGTLIDLRATVNMEITEASIQIAGGAPVPLERVGDRIYRTQLAPKKDVRYAFLLTGPNGERNEPHTFVLRLSRDRAPDLRVRAPSARTKRTVGGVALIAFSARDDHRVSQARFVYKIEGEDEQTIILGDATSGDADSASAAVRFLRDTGASGSPADSSEDGAKAKDGDSVLGLVAMDLARLKRADGSSVGLDAKISYRIEVTDSAGKITKTRDGRMIHTTDERDIETNVAGRQRDLHEGVNRTDTQAATVRVELAELEAASPAASPTGAVSASELRRQLGRAQAATGRLVDQLSMLSGHLRGLVNLYVFNRLDDAATANQVLPFYETHLLTRSGKSDAPFKGALYRELWKAQQASRIRAGGAYLQLLEMADLSDRLAADRGPAAYAALREATRSAGKTDPFELVRAASREQEQIEDGLRRLRRLMREWQSYEGVIRGFRRLKEDEARIVEELTGDGTKKPGSGTPIKKKER